MRPQRRSGEAPLRIHRRKSQGRGPGRGKTCKRVVLFASACLISYKILLHKEEYYLTLCWGLCSPFEKILLNWWWVSRPAVVRVVPNRPESTAPLSGGTGLYRLCRKNTQANPCKLAKKMHSLNMPHDCTMSPPGRSPVQSGLVRVSALQTSSSHAYVLRSWMSNLLRHDTWQELVFWGAHSLKRLGLTLRLQRLEGCAKHMEDEPLCTGQQSVHVDAVSIGKERASVRAAGVKS